MRDMKQRLRRDDFTLELDGPAESILGVATRLSTMTGVVASVRDDHTMVVQVANDQSRAGALAEVLRLIESSGVSLQSVGSGQNETEYAYLQLLQEDTAHGFRRFDFQSPQVVDADSGDLHV